MIDAGSNLVKQQKGLPSREGPLCAKTVSVYPRTLFQNDRGQDHVEQTGRFFGCVHNG